MELIDKSKFIKNQFESFNLNEKELTVLSDLIEVITVKKDFCFLDCAKKSSHFGLIIKGSFYSIAVDKHGNEIIQDVFYETQKPFIIDYESYLQDKVSDHKIIANTESKLILVDIHNARTLYKTYPRFYQMELMVLKQNFVNAIYRIKVLQEQQPSDKINYLKSILPDIFQYFSYSQIASFLGVHRNTLSRALKNK